MKVLTDRPDGGVLQDHQRIFHVRFAPLGLEVYPDDAFDPNIHEAMLAEDTDLDRDTVLEVFQRGYRLGNELLRPARVKVGKAKHRQYNGEQDESTGGE